MARRLLTVGLLLTAAAWCGRAAAKPPDLPLDNKDTLTPQDPLGPVETAQPSQPNPFPPAAESAAPVMEMPSLFPMRPSARRMMASCLLFGANPLMLLTPTADYFDVDADDAPVVPAEFVQPEQLHVMPQEVPSNEHSLIGLIEIGGPATFSNTVPEYGGYAPADSAQSACPYMRQLQCGSPHVDAQADYESAPDVLDNLRMLQQARSLMQKAAELRASGRDDEAAAVLHEAGGLCPGSRIDEAVHQAAAFLLIPFYCGRGMRAAGPDGRCQPRDRAEAGGPGVGEVSRGPAARGDRRTPRVAGHRHLR